MIRRLSSPLALAFLATGCSLLDHSAKVALGSDPPGARVLIDQQDSGFVTPCVLELDPDDRTRMELVLPGYETARRMLVPERDASLILWSDMYLRSEVWHFPLWLNTRDLFEPLKIDKRFSPSRIFVRLERSADK
ncbi:MAG: PEGA domain-containing protein [Planctomycetes bacterium]|nr:PEGA domain-containing protein [Planctomycetota bacterium]